MKLDSNPEGAAKVAGLRYVTDTVPGVARLRAGTGFRYRAADGRMVRERETLARIRKLAIPPAWTEVWISPYEFGHIQAVGTDAAGRRQWRPGVIVTREMRPGQTGSGGAYG